MSGPPDHAVCAGFTGAVVVVTGAASGIGAATAREFAVAGARVALFDINAAGVVEQADSIAADTSAQTLAVTVDVADVRSIRAGLARVAAELGPVRALVNSAVSFTAAGRDATSAQWDVSLGVNVRGTAQMGAECSRQMIAGGAIVNVSSVSAHAAQPDRWTYNSTKGAIVSLTRCQALDLASHGIRVNCVSPGWIWTPEVEKAAEGDRPTYEAQWGRFHILRRLGEPVEVARAVLFLCSDAASFVTGTELMVDGGYSALSAEGLGDASAFAGTV